MAHSIELRPLNLKNFQSRHMYAYADTFSQITGNNSVLFRMGKGQKLFNDGFVSSISFTEPDDAANENFVINCKVRAEMKKRVTYQPSVEIRTTCQGVLLHIVFALLHAMEDDVRSELFYASTERLQTWHHPKPSKTVPQETSTIFKGESSKRRLLNTNFNYNAINFWPFMEVMRNESEVIFEKSILLPAAVCSQKCVDNLPALDIDATLFFHKNYYRNMDERLALERRTMGQNCSEWHLERKLRLTASDTELIISRVADFKTLASQILKKKDGSLDFLPAVKYGLEHEDYIRYNC
ncbi:SWIM-type domain-containing protein [Trichonephila clavipes]|nr:SWIM-type domain-containing protein [Trichonephila clavipes]